MLTNGLHNETRSQEIKEEIKSIFKIVMESLLTYKTPALMVNMLVSEVSSRCMYTGL